jgi:magnesium chelatase accessory protein
MSAIPAWAGVWPHAEASRLVEAGGIRFHVQEAGRGPTILLVHGTGGATHSWRGLLPDLARDFRVIAPDLPGHGFSGPMRGLSTLPAVARSLGALLAALNARPALLVGHSAGAAIACRLVLDGVVAPAGIVSLNGALLPFAGAAGELFPGLARLLFLNPLTPRLFAMQASLTGDVSRFLLRATGSRIDREGVAQYGRLFARTSHVTAALELMASWDLKALQADLPGLSVPLLLVAGSADLAIPAGAAREVAKRVPHADVRIQTALGHLAHEEDPAGTAELVREFATARGVWQAMEAK